MSVFFQCKLDCQQLPTASVLVLEMKATGCNLGLLPKCCEKRALIPDSEASTSTANGLVNGSGWHTVGTVMNATLSLQNASLAAVFQKSHFGHFFRRAVRGAALELKPLMNLDKNSRTPGNIAGG